MWTEVEKLNAEHHLTPPTKTYRDVAELQHATDAAARRDAITHQLAALPDRAHLVGLVARSRRPDRRSERFATPELYGQSNKSCSARTSRVTTDHRTRAGSLLPDDVRAFVENGKRQDTDAAVNIVVAP